MTDRSVIIKEAQVAPKIVDKAERRAVIIQAAGEVFAAKGYQQATVAEIGRRAGMGKGTIYVYFKSKADIFVAVFDAYAGEMVDRREAEVAEDNGPADQVLLHMARMSARDMEALKPLFSLVIDFWASAALEDLQVIMAAKFKQIYDRLRKLLVGLIDRAKAEGSFRPEIDAHALASVYLGCLDGLGFQAWFEDDFNIETINESFWEVLYRGMTIGEAK